jgi:hypothetical protein
MHYSIWVARNQNAPVGRVYTAVMVTWRVPRLRNAIRMFSAPQHVEDFRVHDVDGVTRRVGGDLIEDI